MSGTIVVRELSPYDVGNTTQQLRNSGDLVVYLFPCLSIYLRNCLSIYLKNYLSIYVVCMLYLFQYIYLINFLSFYLSIYLIDQDYKSIKSLKLKP